MNCFAGCSVGFSAGLVHRVSGLDGRGVGMLESTRVIELFVDAESSGSFSTEVWEDLPHQEGRHCEDADVSILFLNEQSEKG